MEYIHVGRGGGGDAAPDGYRDPLFYLAQAFRNTGQDGVIGLCGCVGKRVATTVYQE